MTIAPQAGIAAGDVGYGVILNGIAPPRGERMQNEAMQPNGDAKSLAVGGMEGRSVPLHSLSPFPAASGQQQRERDWLATVPQRNGAVIFMVFVAPHSEFARFEPAYEAMLKSVQFE